MTSWLNPRRLITIAALTLAWCGLWRDLSLPTAVAGAAVAVAVTALGVGTAEPGSVAIRPLLRLIWLVVVDLVRSTVDVAVEILTPTDRTDEVIVEVEVPPAGRDHLLLLAVAITLTPGTAVIDVDADAGTLHLHLLHRRRTDETVRHVGTIAELAGRALRTRGPVG